MLEHILRAAFHVKKERIGARDVLNFDLRDFPPLRDESGGGDQVNCVSQRSLVPDLRQQCRRVSCIT